MAVFEDVEIEAHEKQTKPCFVDTSSTILAYFTDSAFASPDRDDGILLSAYLYVSKPETHNELGGGVIHLHSVTSSPSSTFSLALDQHFRQLVQNLGALSYVGTQRFAIDPSPLPWHFSALSSLREFSVRFGGIVCDNL
jgi:hypothetical protein